MPPEETSSGSGTERQAARPAPSPQLQNLARLASPVTDLPGVGPSYAGKLDALGVRTIGDLLYHFPRKYLDRSNVTPIASVAVGEEATVIGRVRDVESRRTRSRRSLLAVTIFDGTGYLTGVWFNQEYHASKLKEDTLVAFSGKVGFEYNRLQMVNPAYDVLDAPGTGEQALAIHTGRIIPIYPGTAGVTSPMLRRLVSRALELFGDIADPIPEAVVRRFDLMPLAEALREAHFPTSPAKLREALRRAVSDEIFTMQVGLALKRQKRRAEGRGITHGEPGELAAGLVERLPFEFTADQRRALDEIVRDMRESSPMNRLLQGEVGSGKTVVAVSALLLAVEGGFQGAIMAPTEVLAGQHYGRLVEMLEGLPVTVELLTSASPRSVQRAISNGEVDIVVGTHALIQSELSFHNLGLVVIDEQHRFGLEQRSELAAKGAAPDVLHMSATPIPRTLALTLYGDLDVSTIRELPSGRQPVITIVADESQREGAFAMARGEVDKGRQAFVICALVEQSEKIEVRSAQEEVARLERVFPGRRLGLLHGQLKSEEKRSVMADFQKGLIDVLVSTLVVEVGVDVPNATVMIIENADRFGLAQLHQLRGRVGRGSERAICVLFAEPTTDEAASRMKAIKEIEDGFALAEADLQIRGEGTIFGTRQSGLPDLKLTRLSRNIELVQKARDAAFALVDADPGLESPDNRALLWETRRRFGGTLEWLFRS